MLNRQDLRDPAGFHTMFGEVSAGEAASTVRMCCLLLHRSHRS
jgi:hypothetical protein